MTLRLFMGNVVDLVQAEVERLLRAPPRHRRERRERGGRVAERSGRPQLCLFALGGGGRGQFGVGDLTELGALFGGTI